MFHFHKYVPTKVLCWSNDATYIGYVSAKCSKRKIEYKGYRFPVTKDMVQKAFDWLNGVDE